MSLDQRFSGDVQDLELAGSDQPVERCSTEAQCCAGLGDRERGLDLSLGHSGRVSERPALSSAAAATLRLMSVSPVGIDESRNANDQQIAEMLAELRRKEDPREQKRRQAFKASQEIADRCFKCDRSLGPSAEVWRVRQYWHRSSVVLGSVTSSPIVAMCQKCGRAAMADKAKRRGYAYVPEAPKSCQACQRPVVNPYPLWERRHTFCSKHCERDYRATMAREQRRQQRGIRRCEYCGREFEPTRSDRRTCSNAHRQALYRARLPSRTKAGSILRGAAKNSSFR